MSELVLQMPSNYVGVEREEMEYVDGGLYLSYQGVRAVALACSINPVGGVLVALGYARITAMFAAGLSSALGRVGALGGPIGSIVGFSIGALGAWALGSKFAMALIERKGMDFNLRYSRWGVPYMVDVDIR